MTDDTQTPAPEVPAAPRNKLFGDHPNGIGPTEGMDLDADERPKHSPDDGDELERGGGEGV